MLEIERLKAVFERYKGKSLVLIGCGTLEAEVNFIISKNSWPIKTEFLSSVLHIEHDTLYNSLKERLDSRPDSRKVIFYGECHPAIDRLVEEYDAVRYTGQNCVESLLGRARFDSLMAEGAFFLLKSWALKWDNILEKVFGSRVNIAREIFKTRHNYFLALRTVCSGDYQREAEAVSELMDMPLLWLDISLDNLERNLSTTILRQLEGVEGKGDERGY